ncbi:MAG: hypothetical protein IJW22_10220 [Clostridia bacterium]|nr:hypothetical protein [Clostridia bacterium]
MSTFNRFCAKVRRGFIKVGDKVEELGDSASASVRAKGLEIRIDEQYEKLGEIVYRDLHTEEDLEEEKLAVIAAIDALFDELEQIKASKAAKKAEKEAAAAAEEATEEATEECACECECKEAAAEEAVAEEAPKTEAEAE